MQIRTNKPGRSRNWIAVSAAALCACSAAAQPGGGPPPAMVVLDEARREVAEQWREVTGELRAIRRALLAAEEEGLVVELFYEEGDAVKAGETIARLRDTRLKLEVKRSEAELAVKRATLAERQADVEKAHRDVSRMDELQARVTGAQAELDDKRSALAVAEARLDAAKGDVAAAEAGLHWEQERLARTTITAPFACRVIAKRTEVGQWLRQGDPVVEVLALDQIDARLDVPERYVDKLTASKLPIQIRVQATGEILRAPLTAIVPDADPLSRLFPVRVRLENPKGNLRPGMSVIGLVPTGASLPTLTISKDAILRNDAGEYVFYDAGGVAAIAPVRSLFPVGERMAVQSGMLQTGAMVVIEGNERLFPGQPLQPMPPRTPPAAGQETPETKTKDGSAAARTGEGR